jgi:hypothetical protein
LGDAVGVGAGIEVGVGVAVGLMLKLAVIVPGPLIVTVVDSNLELVIAPAVLDQDENV